MSHCPAGLEPKANERRTLALLILWPIPIYASAYIFSKPFFTGWIVVSFIWIFVSVLLVGIYPAWEGRSSVIATIRAVVGSGKGGKAGVVQLGVGGSDGSVSTPEKGDESVDAKGL